MKRFLKSAMWGALSLAFAALTATPALAADPYKLKCHSGQTWNHTVTPVGAVIGKYTYVLSPSGLQRNAALVAKINRESPELSGFVVAFGEKGGSGIPRTDVSIGMWVAVGSAIRSLAVPRSQDDRRPDMAFNRYSLVNLANSTATYNGMQLMSVDTWDDGMSSLGVLGTQVMDRGARELMTDALINAQPFEFGARTVAGKDSAYSWREGSEVCQRRTDLLIAQVMPFSPALDVTPISGEFKVSNGKVIVSAPPQCDNAGSSVACPISAKVGAFTGEFRIEIPSALIGKVWFRTVAGADVNWLPVASVPNSKLVMSANYLDSLLGTQEEVSIDDLVKVDLFVQTVSGGMSIPASLIEKARLKRLTFGVAIDERNTSALGRYSGSIGQDPDITIPLTIRQFGASKATQINVQVVADSVATSNGSRCKFVGNRGATVVGIPANVRFYSGNEFIDRPDNCNGIIHDITTMKWREALGGEFPYMGSLDMDLVFPLSPTDLNLDVSGKAWLGTVEATGEVRVSAEWK